MNNFPYFQDQTNVHSLAHSMKAKTGAPSPRTRHVPGLRGSTAAPRQKHPSSPLQPVTSLTLNQPCSQQHLLSPPVPARWEHCDTVPSGKTERRIANPPMNVWNQWVSRPPPPPTYSKQNAPIIQVSRLLLQDNHRLVKANETLRVKLREAEREVDMLKTLLKRNALHPVEEDSSW